MREDASKLNHPRPLQRAFRLVPSTLARAILLAVFVFAGHGTAEAANIPRGNVDSSGPGLQFAIADFDGDQRADIAYVQRGQNTPASGSYWIDLRLSSVGRKSFSLLEPPGGLAIEARDVNGDNAVDLIVTTTWLGGQLQSFST